MVARTTGPVSETELPTALLLDRVRMMVWVLFVATAGFTLGEVLLRPGENGVVSGVHAALLVGLAALLLPLRRPLPPQLIIAVGLAAATVAAVASAAVAVATGTANTAAFVFVALSMGTAAMVPWGPGPQLGVASILTGLY